MRGFGLAWRGKTGHTATMTSSQHMRGYIEGYYGRLLTWSERGQILGQMASLGMNAYVYAPKEDIRHRVEWRRFWDDEWCENFTAFCQQARALNIDVVAGIAPGLDFNFLNNFNDFEFLSQKSHQLKSAGADMLVLMFDDIEAPSADSFPSGMSEASCHAAIVNQLAEDIGEPVALVPRIYADEIASNKEEATAHYHDLAAALPVETPVFHCGDRIVAGKNPLIQRQDIAADAGFARLILWDNRYCNDYCPRRLFVGPHKGRGMNQELMLNGTGMIETDKLLLAIMKAGDDVAAWRAALADSGVPDVFLCLAPFFDAPALTGDVVQALPLPDAQQMDAIETLLWRWKSPLAREWYPFLFGLKHDSLMASGDLPAERIAKTQSSALYQHLMRRK